MMTKEHIFWLTFIIIYAYAWIHFLGPVDNNIIERLNHGMPVKHQCPTEPTNFPKYGTKTDFIGQPSILRMFLRWIFFVVCEIACLYKLVCDYRSDYKWEYLKKCDILRFLQRQNTTVMCLEDYYRDRLNNNISTHELMKYEWARYESFKTYPQSAPHFPSNLARGGFYYTGERTTITCFCCGCKLDTTRHENIAEGHCHHSPNCSFARGESSANVPIHHGITSSQTGPNGNARNARNVHVTGNLRRQSNCGWLRNIRQIYSTVTLGIGRQETHSTDRMSRDLQSQAAQILRQMGHSDTRIKDAILQFRRMRGNKELSAKALIEYIHDTEPNISGPIVYSSSFLELVSAANSALSDTSHTEIAPLRTANETGTQKNAGTDQLQDEIKKLKQQNVCKICLDKEVCIVFLPCGHLVACDECAPRLRKCAVCRTPIKGTVRTYMS